MLFNSSVYLWFLAASVCLYWFLPEKNRRIALSFFGIFFYAWSDVRFLLLLLVLGLLVWWCGILMDKEVVDARRKAFFFIGLGIVLAVLCAAKYGMLLAASVFGLFGLVPNMPSWLLPLGISFFTFEFMHYLVERYRKALPDHDFLDYMSFMLFFPTLVSGPIKRFPAFIASVREARGMQVSVFLSGIVLILFGYVQKYLIADVLVDKTAFLSTPHLVPSSAAVVSGIFLYGLRIYADFSGLSHIAIGSALLFGIRVPINFSFPYLRKDLAQFWRYWHMSLTSWVRDYVYMPLVFRFRHARFIQTIALIATMAIVGLWHGSSWNFLFFGMYHGIGLAVLQLFRSYRKHLPYHLPNWAGRAFGWSVTFIFVMLGWPLFVTTSFGDSLLLYRAIFATLGLSF